MERTNRLGWPRLLTVFIEICAVVGATASARAQEAPPPYAAPPVVAPTAEVSQCTTTTTTTTTCTGAAAPLAVPGMAPMPAPPPPPTYPPPVANPLAQGNCPTDLVPPGTPLWTEKTVETRERRWGLFITGMSMLGVSYGLTVLFAPSDHGAAYVPLIGPFIAAAQLGQPSCSDSYGNYCYHPDNTFSQVGLVFGGIAQLTGLGLAIAGPLSFTVETETKRVRIALGPGPGQAGFAASGTF